MITSSSVLWIAPIVEPNDLSMYQSASPAANHWQISLISNLLGIIPVRLLNWKPERPWPYGHLFINNNAQHPIPCCPTLSLSYLNLAFLRHLFIFISFFLRDLYEPSFFQNFRYVITYNPSLGTRLIASYLRLRYKSKWISIVADNLPAAGPTAFIFLSWFSYCHFRSLSPSFYLEGAIAPAASLLSYSPVSQEKHKYIFAYSGDFGTFAGVEILVQAFKQYSNPDVELWLCGKGSNHFVTQSSLEDTRIKILGLLNQDDYETLLSKADCFINPRPSALNANKLNFPSKILSYLSYGKPVISTLTAGIPPQYHNLFIVPMDETISGFIGAFDIVYNFSPFELQTIKLRLASFSRNKSWRIQASRLVYWLHRL